MPQTRSTLSRASHAVGGVAYKVWPHMALAPDLRCRPCIQQRSMHK